MPTSTPSRIPEHSTIQDTVEKIQEQLARWQDRCVVCYATQQDSMHHIGQCPSGGGREAAVKAREWSVGPRRMKVQGHVGLCYCCGGPISICSQRRFKGVAIAFIVGVRIAYPGIWREWWDRVQQRSGVTEVEEIPQWIGGQSEAGYGRLIETFMWMVCCVDEQPVASSWSF